MPNVISLRPPSYRRHKPSGRAVVTLSGRDIYLGKYGSDASTEEYRRLIAEYLLSGHVRSVSAASELTVAEVMAAYLGHAAVYYRKAGQLTREYGLIVDCCRVMRPLYGRSPAVEFGPLALKAVRQAMIEADHSRKYINKNIERIRRMFKWAAAEELVPASIPHALSMVAGLRRGRTEARETSPVLPVSDAVVEATLPMLPEIVADMVRLQRLTGARPEEICLLRPQDLDRTGQHSVLNIHRHRPNVADALPLQESPSTGSETRSKNKIMSPGASQLSPPAPADFGVPGRKTIHTNICAVLKRRSILHRLIFTASRQVWTVTPTPLDYELFMPGPRRLMTAADASKTTSWSEYLRPTSAAERVCWRSITRRVAISTASAAWAVARAAKERRRRLPKVTSCFNCRSRTRRCGRRGLGRRQPSDGRFCGCAAN